MLRPGITMAAASAALRPGIRSPPGLPGPACGHSAILPATRAPHSTTTQMIPSDGQSPHPQCQCEDPKQRILPGAIISPANSNGPHVVRSCRLGNFFRPMSHCGPKLSRLRYNDRDQIGTSWTPACAAVGAKQRPPHSRLRVSEWLSTLFERCQLPTAAVHPTRQLRTDNRPRRPKSR